MSAEIFQPPRRVTPTAESHYNPEEFEYHLHDICYNSEEVAAAGDPDQAAFNLRHLLRFQRPDGSLPNQVLTNTASKKHAERYFFNDRQSSDYGQPPVLAQAIKAAFDSFINQGRSAEAFGFLAETYGAVSAFYEFHDRELRFRPDMALIIFFHPHMSGRDRDPILNKFQRYPQFLERNGAETPWLKDTVRVPVGYVQLMNLNRKQRAVRWEIARARQNYSMVDPEFNAKYAQNLEILAGLAEELGEDRDARRYYLLADRVQEDAKEFLWRPEAEWPTPEMRQPGAKWEGAKFTKGLFLAYDDVKGEYVADENSLGNLGAIGFRNLTPEQVDALTRLGVVSYNTFLPFPSVATESRNFDPHYQMKGNIHSGGVWAYQGRFISDSFRWHEKRQDLDPLTRYLCGIMPDIAAGAYKKAFLPRLPEFAHPWTAEAERFPKVRGFNMSRQVNLMEYFDYLSRLTSDDDYFKLCASIGKVLPMTQFKETLEESAA